MLGGGLAVVGGGAGALEVGAAVGGAEVVGAVLGEGWLGPQPARIKLIARTRTSKRSRNFFINPSPFIIYLSISII